MVKYADVGWLGCDDRWRWGWGLGLRQVPAESYLPRLNQGWFKQEAATSILKRDDDLTPPPQRSKAKEENRSFPGHGSGPHVMNNTAKVRAEGCISVNADSMPWCAEIPTCTHHIFAPRPRSQLGEVGVGKLAVLAANLIFVILGGSQMLTRTKKKDAHAGCCTL